MKLDTPESFWSMAQWLTGLTLEVDGRQSPALIRARGAATSKSGKTGAALGNRNLGAKPK